MTPPAADNVSCLICEDIRQELSRRYSFMGVYGSSLEVAGLPALLPAICASVLVKNPKEPFTSVDTEVHDPSGKVIAKIHAEKLERPPWPEYTSVHSIKALSILLETEGMLRFVFRFNGSSDTGVECAIRVRRKDSTE